MSWQQKTIVPPLVDGVDAIVSTLGSAATALENTLGLATSLLKSAKSFYSAGADPYSAAMRLIIDELENLINDSFGASVSYIVVTADYSEDLDLVAIKELTIDKVRKRLGFLEDPDKKKIGRYDFWGNKLITPPEIISVLRRSIDDLNDEKRPNISDSGHVSALGLMVTAANLQDFLPLLDSLGKVLGIKEFEKWANDLAESLKVPDPSEKNGFRGTKPDWEGKKLTDIFPDLKGQQEALLGMLGTLRGYLATADEAIVDLISVMQKKVYALRKIVSDFKVIIDSIQGAVKATGVYVMGISGTGGNTFLKSSLRDSKLENLGENGYSAAVLFVAGGSDSEAAVTAIDALKEMIIS